MMNMRTYKPTPKIEKLVIYKDPDPEAQPKTLLFFSDVLDNITLFYVIRKEVKAEMERQGIKMDSEDEGG